TIHRLTLEEVGVARLGYTHLLQHLANDHADVLVADAHALESVDLLHLVEQVLLHRTRPLDEQDVVRIHGPFSQTVACPDPVALVHPEVLAGRYLVQLRLGFFSRVFRIDIDLALAALDLPELDHPVHLGDGGRILGPPGFEELRDTRETARDVASLVRLARDLGYGNALGHLDRR